MNEINFNVEDIEEINLSMDVGIKKIYPPLENLKVTPTKEKQVFTHENSYGYDNVTVNPIPDEYIIPNGTLEVAENGDIDVTTFRTARVRVYTPPKLQIKEVTPTKEIQSITPDNNYDGLNKVTVNAIPDNYIVPSGSLEITQNGTYDVKEYAETVVNVEGSSGGGDCLGQPFPILEVQNSVYGGLGSVTSHSVSLYAFNHSGKESINPDMALVFWFARSNCSISDNVIQIYESEEFSHGGFTQKLYIGYMEYEKNATITLTQETSARLGLGYLPLCNCGIPQVVNSEMISSSGAGDYSINTDEYLNVYLLNNIYTFNSVRANTNLPTGGQIASSLASRIGYVLANSPIENAKISNNDIFYGCIVQVRCPTKGK